MAVYEEERGGNLMTKLLPQLQTILSKLSPTKIELLLQPNNEKRQQSSQTQILS
jgi:hypothetical protein